MTFSLRKKVGVKPLKAKAPVTTSPKSPTRPASAPIPPNAKFNQYGSNISKDPKFAAKLAEAISPAQQLSIPISRAASPMSISSLDDSAAEGGKGTYLFSLQSG